MPIYEYTAIDYAQKRRTGSVDARTGDLAVTLLKNQGLYVVNLEEKRSNILDELLNIRGVPAGEVVAFTRQFSTMISAGLPISRALEVLGEQHTNQAMKKIILDVLRDVEGGASLSTAFGRYPRVFSQTYQSLVRAGESSGKLDTILKRLATNMEAERELSQKFAAAMIYPAIVFFAMIGVFILMMVFVIPKLAGMYKSLNVELPFMTQVMIAVSDFMVEKFYLVIGGLVGTFFGLRAFLRTDMGNDVASYLAFHTPVFGKINTQKEVTQFARTLSLLINAAIPIVEALNTVSGVVSNKLYKEAAVDAAKRVEKGGSLSEYFKQTKIFPALLGQMASVGEETGGLGDVFDRVADYFEGEVDNSVKGLSAALEPIILIMLGGMVGVLIISIITPIYKITSAL